MRLMGFPRYIKRQTRDFFYLTLRHLLPGAPLRSPGVDDATFDVGDLPQHGFPYAIATAERIPDPERPSTKVRYAKLDAKYLRFSEAPDGPVVATLPADETGTRFLFLHDGQWAIGADAPDAAKRLAAERSEHPTAAFGVSAHDGMLYYAEVVTGRDPTRDPALLERTLRQAGCEEILLGDAASLLVGGRNDLSGHPAHAGGRRTYLLRQRGPTGSRVFTDTPVVPRSVWRPIQNAATQRSQR
jgi:hypothetical protein